MEIVPTPSDSDTDSGIAEPLLDLPILEDREDHQDDGFRDRQQLNLSVCGVLC